MTRKIQQVTVVPANLSHRPGMAMVWKAAFSENVKASTINNILPTSFVALTQMPGDETVAGFITLVLKGDTCRIDYIASHVLDAPKGTGKILMEHAATHAKGWGCKRLQLAVRRVNTRAIKFYEREGFIVTDERPGGFTMTKELADVRAA